ncbi:hypothetical protein BKA65DRAFT_541174 [Rhexocercosporidium sp. MPI-PUGE-AT-0058]|nr:hypothetical protein BKA65DRAFT_541174 [Rhexocercosporidium sp. MPI-PUGE-AT-0058]
MSRDSRAVKRYKVLAGGTVVVVFLLKASVYTSLCKTPPGPDAGETQTSNSPNYSQESEPVVAYDSRKDQTRKNTIRYLLVGPYAHQNGLTNGSEQETQSIEAESEVGLQNMQMRLTASCPMKGAVSLADLCISRARRVKCDEKKPACDRCSNFGRVCGGYPSTDDNPLPRDHPPVIRKLLSKPLQAAPSPISSAQVSTISPPPPLNHSPLSLPPGVAFQEERCYQYFCHFRDVTSLEFSSGFDPALWRSLVAQACDTFPIRTLVVATAALSIFVNGPLHQTSEQHLEYALQKYGEALKGIREMVAARRDSTRVALISALLIFCFESLHGDFGRAMTHIQSAIDMIIKQLSKLPQAHHFSRVGARDQHSNAPVDDDLLVAFMRLDQPSLALMSRQKGYPPLPAHRIFTMLFSAEHLDIPESFATISEARSYLEDIQWRILSNNHASDAISPMWDDSEAQSVLPDLAFIPWQLQQWFRSTDIVGTSSHLGYRLAQWHDAFHPMLNYALTPAGDSMFVPAIILHVQAMIADLTITGFALQSQTRVNSFSSTGSASVLEPQACSAIPGSLAPTVPNPDFFQLRSSSEHCSSGRSSPALVAENLTGYPTVHAILSFCRRLVSHPGFLRGFVFDTGVIPPLLKIVLLCPERMLRKEAIDILRSMAPRREGMWDSRVCAEAGEKCIAMEDSNQGLGVIDPFLIERT